MAGHGHSHSHAAEKGRVVTLSVLASLFMTLTKFAAGILTGSLGIISEAIHSLIDLLATIITWFAVKWSDAPPDEDHHYGHAKTESLAALIETALLFVTTIWIIYEAVNRLLHHETEVEVTWWSMGIIILAIVIDFNRARSLTRVAEKTGSEALAADALHFSSDMWSSLCVLVGLALVWAGFAYADSIAAIVVSLLILRAAWQLWKSTVASLLDAAPAGATDEIRKILDTTPGIIKVDSLRIRPAGPTLFVSTVFDVPRTMPVDVMVKLKQTVSEAIKKQYPNSDITVTANPVVLDDETVFQKVAMIASRRKQLIHYLTVQEMDQHMAVSFDLEVDGTLSLAQAHEQASELEEAIRAELGSEVEVESHIEPRNQEPLTSKPVPAEQCADLMAALTALAAKAPGLSDLHNIRVRESEFGFLVHYHCRFAGSDSVELVHDTLTPIEVALQKQFPKVRRVIAHAEPLGVPHPGPAQPKAD